MAWSRMEIVYAIVVIIIVLMIIYIMYGKKDDKFINKNYEDIPYDPDYENVYQNPLDDFGVGPGLSSKHTKEWT